MIYRYLEHIHRRYPIIYCDPPWAYRDNGGHGRGLAENHYETKEEAGLTAMRVADIAAEDAVMFMWCTWPMMIEGTCMRVMDAWGFRPVTCAFVWMKRERNYSPVLSLGNWTRSNTEFVILGRRGKFSRLDAGISQVIETHGLIETFPDRHSKKPWKVRDEIVRLCGDLPRIELFARYPAPGWDSFGNDPMLDVRPLEAYT